ncbi:MAG: serine/threonine-protein kinase [Kofleriaceae bacterium]
MGGLLGRGGMGEVRIARHTSGRIVAIKRVRKTLSLDPLLCERLTEEAEVLRKIDHPNVVNVLEGGTDEDGKPYLVMERAYGMELDVMLHKCGPMPRDRVTAIASQLFDGLIAIHDAGVIHADLKASNILVDELDRVTIIDFGLARAATAEQHEILGGTPAYMAPEVLSGGVPTIQSDLFSVGVIIYELLTGTPPLQRRLPAMVILNLRLHAPTELPSMRAPHLRITPALDAVLARALDRDPAQRFQSAREFGDALNEALAGWDSFDDEDAPTLHKITTTRIPIAVETEVLQPATQPLVTTTDEVITRSLDTASALVAEREIRAAVKVLEATMATLAPTDLSQMIAPEVWRIQTVLAALYQSLGMKDHALRHARVAIQNAARTNDALAKSRTRAVMRQVQADQGRIARGSRQAPMHSKKR